MILGVDVSTATIGVCLLEDNNTDKGKIIELTHISPKVSTKIDPVEQLFLKKKLFEEFIQKYSQYPIEEVIIEEPLMRSNNVNTVSVLLRFNGMISDCVYNVLGIVPKYISSYDARKYAFPELVAVRKYSKENELYEPKRIIKEIEKNKFVLFGSYPWTVDKKTVLQEKVAELFPEIPWLYDKKGELKKQNFDSCDAYVACLGWLKKQKNGEPVFKATDVEIHDDEVNYNVSYWNKVEPRTTYLNR